MTSEATTTDQIAEYESQLAEIELLLAESPEDESLLSVKRDIEELLQLTKGTATTEENGDGTENAVAGTEVAETTPAQTGESVDDVDTLDLPPPPSIPPPPSDPSPVEEGQAANNHNVENEDDFNLPVTEAATAAAVGSEAPAAAPVKKSSANGKKRQKVKEFVIPAHLIIKENDSEAEKNRKKRTAKALKNKWREKKKEVETDNRQKSWQSFQKKSSKKRKNKEKGESIFATTEGGVNDRVGVISKKQMTEFGARKRHQQF